MQVDCYGLHWDGAVAWLVQGRKGTNFAGLKGTCPFQADGGMCNHLIPTASPIPDPIHWQEFSKIFDDPLVQAMLPIPNQKMVYVDDPDQDLLLYLSTLSRLSSPIKPIVRPAWMLKARELRNLLWESNLQPLIITQVDQKTQPLIDAIGQLGGIAPRSVILVGKPELVVRAPVTRITTDIRKFDLNDLAPMPLESIGALLLRRCARKEPLDAPLEKREDRRDRLIAERTKR